MQNKNQIQIRENAPDWIKVLPQNSLRVLARLFHKYVGEFAFGLAGHNGRRVEIDVEGEDMEPILESLPTTQTKAETSSSKN
jgi:hypothetical protein